MGTFKTVEEATAFFKNDRFATENGVELVELDDEHALTRLVIEPRHRNAIGAVMGGAIFTLADLAISAHGTQLYKPVIGMDNNIHYLSGAKGDVLCARSRCLKNGHTTIILEAEVTDDTGRLVAEMTGTAFKLKPAD